MKEKVEVFVLGVRPVKFTDNESGEVVEGTTVHYVDYKNKNEIGYEPARAFLKGDEGKHLVNSGVGIYDAVFRIELGGNRPRLMVEGFEFKSDKDLFSIKQ